MNATHPTEDHVPSSEDEARERKISGRYRRLLEQIVRGSQTPQRPDAA